MVACEANGFEADSAGPHWAAALRVHVSGIYGDAMVLQRQAQSALQGGLRLHIDVAAATSVDRACATKLWYCMTRKFVDRPVAYVPIRS